MENSNRLLGGAYKCRTNESSVIGRNLKLQNPGTNCFVNSVIQMMRKTDYAKFLQNHFKFIDMGSERRHFDLSYSILSILDKEGSNASISTNIIRSLVASKSDKPYLNEGRQEDAAEFLEALELALSSELSSLEDYWSFKNKHWGKKEIARKFDDNDVSNGSCVSCGSYPSGKQDLFFLLQVMIPKSNNPVKLSSIIEYHISCRTEIIQMRCSNCCELQNHPSACPQTGTSQIEVSKKKKL